MKTTDLLKECSLEEATEIATIDFAKATDIKVQQSNAKIVECMAKDYRDVVKDMWGK